MPEDAYEVVRAQDGAMVCAELSLDDARFEAARLNAEARRLVGTTAPVRDKHNRVVEPARPIYAGMFHGEATRYEVRSALGMVVR